MSEQTQPDQQIDGKTEYSQIYLAVESLKEIRKSTSDNSLLLDKTKKYLSEQLIVFLQKSILAGEQYLPSTENEIAALENAISSLYDERIREITDAEYQSKILEISNARKVLQANYFPDFKSLINAVQTSLENLSNDLDGLIIDTHKFHGYPIYKDMATLLLEEINTEKSERIDNYYLFLINILLAYIDDYLECDEQTKSILEGIENRLFREASETPLLKILIQKAQFLKYKIDFRNYRSNKHIEKNVTSPESLGEDHVFYDFENKIKKHYSEKFGFATCDEEVEKIKNRKAELTLEQFHHLNRYYYKRKDIDCDASLNETNALLDILNQFKTDINSLSTYDQHAFKSVDKLLRNSSFGLSLTQLEKSNYSSLFDSFRTLLKSDGKNHETDLSALQQRLQEIREAHTFPDYYCYYLFLKFLNKFISSCVQHPEIIITNAFLDEISQNPGGFNETTKTEFRKKLEKLKEHIELVYNNSLLGLKMNLRLMVTHKVKPVYLRTKECNCYYSFEYEKKQWKLFLDSSYILPINLEQINQKVELWEALAIPQLNNLQYAFEMALNRYDVQKNVLDFDKKVEGQKKEFNDTVELKTKAISDETKKNEFKTVSILSMFISISTFILINVKIFDNKTSKESLGILLGLASCFVIFNLFFYITTVLQTDERGLRYHLKRSAVYIGTILILAIGSYCILHSEQKNNATKITDLKSKIERDSATIHRLDSENIILQKSIQKFDVIIDSIIRNRK